MKRRPVGRLFYFVNRKMAVEIAYPSRHLESSCGYFRAIKKTKMIGSPRSSVKRGNVIFPPLASVLQSN